MERIEQYRDLAIVRDRLRAHRPDGLQNLKAVGQLTWNTLAEILGEAATSAPREDERAYARRAAEWMRERRLTSGPAPSKV